MWEEHPAVELQALAAATEVALVCGQMLRQASHVGKDPGSSRINKKKPSKIRWQ
jgi:hypothetical protein